MSHSIWFLSSPRFGGDPSGVASPAAPLRRGRFGAVPARRRHTRVTISRLLSKAGIRGRRPPGEMVSRARVMLVRRRASAELGLHRHAAVVVADAREAVPL